MIIINAIQLKAIQQNANISFLPALNTLLPLYSITTPEQVAAFVAQAVHESQGFNKLRESLSYSAERLLAVFPWRIKTLQNAKSIVGAGPIAIGDAVYGGRYGNGLKNGDGYRYRGGGIGHLTFLDNYRVIGKAIGIDLVAHPELISTPDVAVKSFCQFWKDNGCNALLAAKDGGIDAVSKKINGGVNGLAERHALYSKALAVLKPKQV